MVGKIEDSRLNLELLLDEADHAAKETYVRYIHRGVFSRVTKSIEEVQTLKN